MTHRPRLTLLTSAIGLATLDQLTKWMAKAWLIPDRPLPIIPQVFQLDLAFNTGAAFSLFRHQPLLLTGFTTLLFLVLLVYSLSRPYYNRYELPALALMIGGALGNVLDRLIFRQVTDFFDLVVIHYPVFNVADSFIFCGALLLIASHLRTTQSDPKPSPHQKTDEC